MLLSDSDAYEVLLSHLTPADHASLRLVSRSWQALVDRSLGRLHPLAVTPLNFGFGGVPCLVYKSLFQSSSIRQHLLDGGPVYAGFYLIGRQFTSLHTLAVDCVSKGCVDYEHLHLLPQLRRLRLAQFSFADDAFERGLARCSGLQVLHVECHQTMMQVRSLRHLRSLQQLQELVLKPRGYINVPPVSATVIGAMSALSKLTHLQLVTAIKPSRTPALGDFGGLQGLLPEVAALPAGRPIYFDAAATAQLSNCLACMRGLQVLRLCGVAYCPPAVGGLPQLKELSLERAGHVDRAALSSLQQLSQLTALTLITAADLEDFTQPQLNHINHQNHHHQQQQQQWAAIDPVAAAAAFGMGAAAGGAGGLAAGFDAHLQPYAATPTDSSSSSEVLSLLPLLLPSLQELVAGCIPRGPTLNLTTTLTHNLEPPQFTDSTQRRGLSRSASAAGRFGSGTCAEPWQQLGLGFEVQTGVPGVVLRQRKQGLQREWFLQGSAGKRYEHQDGAEVTAYVTPQQWSDLAGMQGLQHVAIEARGWHSAAVTARYNSVGEAVASLMSWHCIAPPTAADCNSSGGTNTAPEGDMHAALASSNHQQGLLAGLAHMVGIGHAHGSSSSSMQGGYQHSGECSEQAAVGATPHDVPTTQVITAGAVGAFFNHPSRAGYIPNLPPLLVLAIRPSIGGLGLLQKQFVRQQLLQLQQVSGGAGMAHPLLAQGAAAGGGGGGHPPESAARRLLLAQLRASMHPSKLLIVLAASATSITRLELTVDQSWPSSVLASLGQLRRLKQLQVLKLDCGRQDPPPGMWAGLSGLTTLRWLCLRWLEWVPVACLAPLTNLVALQLKAISTPPAAAELAEVLAGMPHIAALAIEGGLLDVEGDWLRDTAGLIRHGRWTSSWVEHTLCRQQRLRILGSITAALLMAVALNSPKWPEMIITAILAAAAGAIFVLAVAASLLGLMLDSNGWSYGLGSSFAGHQAGQASGLRSPDRMAGGLFSTAAAAAPPAGESALDNAGQNANVSSVGDSSRSSSDVRRAGGQWCVGSCCVWLCSCLVWWLNVLYRVAAGWWMWLLRPVMFAQLAAVRGGAVSIPAAAAATGGTDFITDSSTSSLFEEFDTASAAAGSSGSSEVSRATGQPGIAWDSAADSITNSVSGFHTSSSSSNVGRPSAVADPGAAFRRLRFLSLRRCTITSHHSSISNRMWEMTNLTTHLGPGFRSQLVAVMLGLLLWPLAAGGALSRIAASSSYQAERAAGGWGVLWSGLSSSAVNSAGAAAAAGNSGAGAASSSAGSHAYTASSSNRGRGKFAGWGWYWDALCGLLQSAANRVEVAAVGRGSALVGLVSGMPALKFLDVTWLNIEPWELHGLAQLKQLHYLGLGKQQLGVLMSQEARFGRSCRLGSRRRNPRFGRISGTSVGTTTGSTVRRASSSTAAGRCSSSSSSVAWCKRSWLFLPLYWSGWLLWWACAGFWGLSIGGAWMLLPSGFETGRWWDGWSFWGSRSEASAESNSRLWDETIASLEADACWLEGGPAMVLVEAPAGFDEVIEREIMAGVVSE